MLLHPEIFMEGTTDLMVYSFPGEMTLGVWFLIHKWQGIWFVSHITFLPATLPLMLLYVADRSPVLC